MPEKPTSPQKIISTEEKEGASSAQKLLGLDHLRAFAIIYVMLFHYQYFAHPNWITNIAPFGWTGVDLFFVLSGYLIAGQLFATVAAGKQISLIEFFTKRFFRIIPPFLVVITLYFLFPVLREWGQPSPLWRYLTFTLNFGLDLSKYGTFSHAWSLCVEEQFYLVLPLICLLFVYLKQGAKAPYLLIVLFVGGFLLRLWNWDHFMVPVLSSPNSGLVWNEYIYYPTYNRLDGLLVGVSIAGLFTFFPNVKAYVNRYSIPALLSGIFLLVFSAIVCKDYHNFDTAIWGFPMIALGYGLILAAVVCPNNPLFQLRSFITTRIATLSYAMYLCHKIVIHVVQLLLGKLGMDTNSGLVMLLCFAAIFIIATLMRYIIEKPALKWRNKVLKRFTANSKPGLWI